MIDRCERMRGAIWGQFIGDALALGSHWHYDLAKRDSEVYPSGIHGFEEPAEGHYHAGRKPGDFTHYGDAGMVLLRHLVRHDRFDAAACAGEFVAAFKNYGGYLDKATKAMLANAASGQELPAIGGEDDQTGGMSRSALVALSITPASDADIGAVMETATRITQNHADAVSANQMHGRLMRLLLDGRPMADAIEQAVASTASPFVVAALAKSNEQLQLPIVEATGLFGRACRLESTLPSMLHAVLRDGHSLVSALLETVRAGGDNAARASVVGAWLGAAHGAGAIPEPWRRQLTARDELGALIDKFVARFGETGRA